MCIVARQLTHIEVEQSDNRRRQQAKTMNIQQLIHYTGSIVIEFTIGTHSSNDLMTREIKVE